MWVLDSVWRVLSGGEAPTVTPAPGLSPPPEITHQRESDGASTAGPRRPSREEQVGDPGVSSPHLEDQHPLNGTLPLIVAPESGPADAIGHLRLEALDSVAELPSEPQSTSDGHGVVEVQVLDSEAAPLLEGQEDDDDPEAGGLSKSKKTETSDEVVQSSPPERVQPSHEDRDQRQSMVLAWLQEQDQELPRRARDGPSSAPTSPLPLAHSGAGPGPGQSRVSALRQALLEQASPFSPKATRSHRMEMDPLQLRGAQGEATRAPEPEPEQRHTADKAVQIDPHPQLVQDLRAFFSDRTRGQVDSAALEAQAAPCKAKPLRIPDTSGPNWDASVPAQGEGEGQGPLPEQPPPCDSPRPLTQAVNGDPEGQRGGDRAPHTRTREDVVEDKCLESCLYYCVHCCDCTIL